MTFSETKEMKSLDLSGSFVTSMPSTRAVPEVGLRKLRMRLIVVVFPAPLAPNMQKISPGSTLKVRWSTASSPSSYSLVSSWVSIIGDLSADVGLQKGDVRSGEKDQ